MLNCIFAAQKCFETFDVIFIFSLSFTTLNHITFQPPICRFLIKSRNRVSVDWFDFVITLMFLNFM